MPSTMMRLVAYIDQMNSGSRNQVRPGARIVWIVTMKFSPVRIDEKPAMKTPDAPVTTTGSSSNGAVGRVERPAGVDAAGEPWRTIGEQAADHEDVPAQQVELREGQIPGADHHRHEEVAQHRGDRRNQEEEDHDHAVHREQAVVRLGASPGRPRRQQLQAHEERERAADEEEA